MSLINNSFINNSAYLGAGAIYFNNKILPEYPKVNNKFIDNIAKFSPNFLTFPVRLKLITNFNRSPKTGYSLKAVIPGITSTSLLFNVTDYFGNTIESINGG